MTYRSGRTAAGSVRPAELEAAAPRGTAFCYDTMAEVLRWRYVELLQREEIRVELAARGVPISTGSVSNLSRLGLACLEQVHQAAAAQLYRGRCYTITVR